MKNKYLWIVLLVCTVSIAGYAADGKSWLVFMPFLIGILVSTIILVMNYIKKNKID